MHSKGPGAGERSITFWKRNIDHKFTSNINIIYKGFVFKVEFPARDGAVVAHIKSREWAAGGVQGDSVLVCGGADTRGHVTDTCVWLTPGVSVTRGPRMSVPRYQAAVITRPGLVWVLGQSLHHPADKPHH